MNQDVNNNWNELYMWCVNCWDYQRFIFGVDLAVLNDLACPTGSCCVCAFKQQVLMHDVFAYYRGIFDQGEA